jgi:hypothetical protein
MIIQNNLASYSRPHFRFFQTEMTAPASLATGRIFRNIFALIWVLGAVWFLACIACAVLAWISFTGLFKSSEVFQLAMIRIREHPAAVEILGTPIQDGLLVSGSISQEGSSGSANLVIPVSGPKGSGTLYVTAQKWDGKWSLTALELAVGNPDRRLNLLDDSKEK